MNETKAFAVRTKALTKQFGDYLAVDGIDLQIAEGELFALLGVNGAGKTTTIKMLTGLILPTSGEASLMGYDLRRQAEDVKRVTNVSPQETAVAPLLSVRENLELIGGIYGQSKAEAKDKAARMMSTFHIDDRASTPAGKLSGGLQRRLSIAMGLISDPKILFLDEPTLGLDVLARRELWETVSRLKGKVTIVLTTHYLEEAVALSDRIGIMAHGKLKAVGTADELIALAECTNFEDAFVKIASDTEEESK